MPPSTSLRVPQVSNGSGRSMPAPPEPGLRATPPIAVEAQMRSLERLIFVVAANRIAHRSVHVARDSLAMEILVPGNWRRVDDRVPCGMSALVGTWAGVVERRL